MLNRKTGAIIATLLVVFTIAAIFTYFGSLPTFNNNTPRSPPHEEYIKKVNDEFSVQNKDQYTWTNDFSFQTDEVKDPKFLPIIASQIREYPDKTADNLYREYRFPYGKTVQFTNYHDSLWRNWDDLLNLPKWEPATFHNFHRFLKKNMTYFGFGEWVGPTILFASHYVKRAVGVEPDPISYAILDSNIKKNNRNNIELSNLCIGDKHATVDFAFEGTSDSLVVEESYIGRPLTEKVSVLCVPFEYFMVNMNIQPPLFIKVDCEGCERRLYTTFLNLTKKMSPRPIIHLSNHAMLHKFTDEDIKNLAALINSYDHAFLDSLEISLPVKQVNTKGTYTLVPNELYC